MLRYLLSGVVMAGAVMVLLAGTLGNLSLLPELSTDLPTSVAHILPGNTPASTNEPTYAPPPVGQNDAGTTQPPIASQDAGTAQPPIASRDAGTAQPPIASQDAGTAQPPIVSNDAGTAQPAIDALNQQLAQLQQRVDQRSKELDTLRNDETVQQQKLTALQQQRQSETAAVAQLQVQHQELESTQRADASSAFAAAAQQKSANAALQKQSADLLTQIQQQSDELASLRSSEDQERHALDALHQQRRAEEDAVARLQSQKEQLTAAVTSPPVSPPQARRPTSSGHVLAANDTMQGAVAQLRAREREVSSPPSAPVQATSLPPIYVRGAPGLIVATKGVLITARELVASGRPAEARQVLMKAQAESALHPVTPGRPYATGGSVVAAQIGSAIQFLDAGNSEGALQAINLAMDNVGG